MPRYWPEPAFEEGSPDRTGVLLVNLGTPAAPTPAALRPYLKQFLSDPRVVEIPRALWWPILHGIVLNTRPAKSARKYASVWMREGSPLQVYTERQAKLLKGRLGQEGLTDFVVDWAMRYGKPSIAEILERLKAAGCARILILPLYPQYAASATASVMDEVARCITHWRNLPELRYVRSFPDHPGYIAALEARVREHWMKHGQGDKLVMSFHGIPRRSVERGDPYQRECEKTARLLAKALRLPEERWQMTFQSRFGKAEWLQPYTQPTLEKLAKSETASVDVICPGFAGDCLETLEEIAIECKQAFLGNGGKIFQYIPCLNDRSDWIAALADLVREHLNGWISETSALPAELAASATRAQILGTPT